MQARMTQPAVLVPEAMKALQAFGDSAESGDVSAKTLGLVHLRASQINGCGRCIGMHRRLLALKDVDETDERLDTVAVWREAPYFTDAERAALALTEAVTRLSDRADPVPDEIWDEAARHFDKKALAALLIYIASTNTWNRLNVATRQVAGEWMPGES